MKTILTFLSCSFFCFFSYGAEKDAPTLKEIARLPANTTQVGSVPKADAVYKFVDDTEKVVCYVATGYGTGSGHSIYCIKK